MLHMNFHLVVLSTTRAYGITQSYLAATRKFYTRKGRALNSQSSTAVAHCLLIDTNFHRPTKG